MTRVKMSYRMSEGVPKSLRAYSATSSEPAATAGRTCRVVTVSHVAHAPRPSERATSSRAGSAPRSAATAGR